MVDPSSSSPPSPQPSDAEREEVLDRMLTRLALADDSNLQPLLSKILPYSIASLSSPSPSVRKMVMEILGHINKRVKHQLDIGLPLAKLWEMYQEESSSPMVRNFCIVYIEMAFDRLPMSEKENMAPELVYNISRLLPKHQDIILRLVVKVIGECHSCKVEDSIAIKYKKIAHGRDRETFIEFCLQVILYYPPASGIGSSSGLSISQTERVCGKLPLKGEVLSKKKIGILNVIESMELPLELVYPIFLVACADNYDPVLKKGEELLKKKSSLVNLEDRDLIARLFLLFNGTAAAENIAAESRVSPGSIALRLRLMSIFCRSIAAANSFPSTLQCIFGCFYGGGTTSRLKQLGMEFTVWIFKHATADQLKLVGPLLLGGILRLLDSQNAESDVSGDIKRFAFEAIGLLATRLPHLFKDKIDMATRLFNALKVEDQSLRFTVQEATTSLASAYKGATGSILKEVESLLLENSHAEQSEVRFCVVRWATMLFDLQHCPSRFICMVATDDSRMDIREMGYGGLCLANNREQSGDSKESLFPKAEDMLNYIFGQQPKLLNDADISEKLLFPSRMYAAMINFLMKCFEAEYQHDSFHSKPDPPSIHALCHFLEHAMSFEGSIELQSTACKALITVGSHEMKCISLRYAERIPWVKQLILHIDSDTRESASRLLGFACSSLSPSRTSDLINELMVMFKGKKVTRFENQHGVLCALGYVVAESIKSKPKIQDSLIQSVVKFLVDVVLTEGTSLASIAMESLGHIGLRCRLPELFYDQTSVAVGVLEALKERLQRLLSDTDIKAAQKIAISLGHLSVKETSSSLTTVALDLIFTLSRSKVEDVLFAAGEALSFIWGGVPVTADVILNSNFTTLSQSSNFLSTELDSSAAQMDFINDDSDEYHILVREVIIKWLFDKLLYSSRKEERCAGTVWLVSLIMYCGYHRRIQQLLPEIQEAFSHLLGDTNELTQELASQGMSIVYEIGDASIKQGLVDVLVSTLTGSGKRKRAVKLMEDTEVFQEGSIGEKLDGGKLSTYKELCNLANEMGQPDLIYKFMDLANYQASLNSKRGAAFGFSRIAKHAGEALQTHLSSLIPRLFRYQHDPDRNVQDAMVHIWKSIVIDSKKTIDDYFDLIVDDLLVHSGSRLWRSREASCLALADVIQGCKFLKVSKHLERLWTSTFRSMDDIKETVRNSGESLCRTLSSLTIRLCDPSLTDVSEASQTMAIVLPLLLSEGIVSKVSSVQKVSISLVMKLSKNAGSTLQPHLSDLICCMLESLSNLEDQRLNYVELHAVNAGIDAGKLENLRIAVAKDSPMWQTIDHCLNFVDAKMLDVLVPRLAQLVRSGVGLNTRVGVANFVTLLVQKVAGDIQPFTGLLLKLLFRAAVEEKGGAAKRAFASACALTLKYARPSQAMKLIEDTASLHLIDRNSKISCAILLKRYLSLASDITGGYLAIILPVSFVSRFEDDKDVNGLFEELWEENAGSERISIQLYLSEIISLLTDCLGSSSWSSKKKSAKAIRKLGEVLGDSISPHHHFLIGCLLKEMSGRFWEGKETIIYAIGSICSSCHKVMDSDDPGTSRSVLQAIISACTKKVKSYREAALCCLQQIIDAFADPEFFRIVFPLLANLSTQATTAKAINHSLLKTSEETGEANSGNAEIPLEKVLDCVSSCISASLLPHILEEGVTIMEVFRCSLSPGQPWTVKKSVFSSIRALCSKFDSDRENFLDTSRDGKQLVNELFHFVAPKVIESLASIKISQVHVAASQCLLDIVNLYKVVPPAERREPVFKAEVVQLCEVEKSEEAKSLLKRCIAAIEELGKAT